MITNVAIGGCFFAPSETFDDRSREIFAHMGEKTYRTKGDNANKTAGDN